MRARDTEVTIIPRVVTRGARGPVLGTLCGALLMAVIDGDCTMMKYPGSVKNLVIGAIVIGAVTLDQFRQRRLSA